MNDSIIKIDNLNACYGAINALYDVTIEVAKGEIVSLIGANGAGKSTLLQSIFKIPTITSGNIYYNNKNITKLPAHKITGLGIALVPEGRRIFPKMSVEENLLLGCTPVGYENFDEDSKMVFSLFEVLEQRKKQLAGTLSGGEQQMLAIGRALMSRPKLLLLDEPSLGLAPIIIKNIFKTLVDIQKKGTTIFLVEQNAHMALKISSRAYLLVNGQITASGAAEKMLKDPSIIESYLGAH